MLTIGVLAMQGAVYEHLSMLKRVPRINVISVRDKDELAAADALILPGGESTTIGKLLDRTGMMKRLKERIKAGMPVWGTCAGMILLSKEIDGAEQPRLAVMNIKVKRNGYGAQLDSFEHRQIIPCVSQKPFNMVFIRAPFIMSAGENVQVIASIDGRIVAAAQDKLLATSFHPELTDDLSFHEYFLSICEKARKSL